MGLKKNTQKTTNCLVAKIRQNLNDYTKGWGLQDSWGGAGAQHVTISNTCLKKPAKEIKPNVLQFILIHILLEGILIT